MSTTITLPAKVRTMLGHQAKKLIRTGLLPAVVYSKKTGSQAIEIDYKTAYKTIKTAGTTHVVNIEITDEKGKTKIQPSLVQDIDIHPVKGVLRHVDFLAVNLKEKITASVPLVYVGEALGIKEEGGVLVINIDEVKIEALPNNLPEEIQIDVTNLAHIHDSIKITDLPLNENYKIITESDLPLVILSGQTVETETETTVVTEVVKGVKDAAKEEK
jgi:large subunit ribosomal protein L25